LLAIGTSTFARRIARELTRSGPEDPAWLSARAISPSAAPPPAHARARRDEEVARLPPERVQSCQWQARR